ncbi:zinc metalloprotease [Anopheles sinensis]|uniref:Zinc metalloprotease n=1 Tax=Anopheles sinensis TaxID=74873 RepID=A0A084WFT1_ANOSI|nr:zinc metalloprotease [Anopheles sinensis]
MDGNARNMWQTEFVEFFGAQERGSQPVHEQQPVKTEAEEYLDELQEQDQLALAVGEQNTNLEGMPQLRVEFFGPQERGSEPEHGHQPVKSEVEEAEYLEEALEQDEPELPVEEQHSNLEGMSQKRVEFFGAQERGSEPEHGHQPVKSEVEEAEYLDEAQEQDEPELPVGEQHSNLEGMSEKRVEFFGPERGSEPEHGHQPVKSEVEETENRDELHHAQDEPELPEVEQNTNLEGMAQMGARPECNQVSALDGPQMKRPDLPTLARMPELVQESMELTTPELPCRPGIPDMPTLANMPELVQETMPELPRAPGIPDLETLARMQDFVQESRPMELSMEELTQRSGLPFTQPAQLDNRKLPDMPNIDLDGPMPEPERQSGQPDVGPRLAEFNVPGLERPVEVRLMNTIEYWPRDHMRPQAVRPESERQPEQFPVRQMCQPGHSCARKFQAATPYPLNRSTAEVSSSSHQPGPSTVARRPRQIAVNPQPSTSWNSPHNPLQTPRLTLNREFVRMQTGMTEAQMRAYPSFIEFMLDEQGAMDLLYRCSICRADFTDLKAYNNHTRIEHKHVVCPRCNRLLTLGRLDRHLRMCPAYTCFCRLCVFTTKLPCELQKHLRTVHNLPGRRCLTAHLCYFCSGGR